MSVIKAVIFDVDGTLLDTERIYMDCWRKAGSARGYTVPEQVLMDTRGVRTEEAVALFRKACGEDFPYTQIRTERIRLAEAEIAVSPASVLQKPGAEALLRWLKNAGYAIAAATSTDRQKTDVHLRQAQLLEYLDAVVCGDMVAHGKPAPDIFLKAAALLGVEPEACLAVGDTPADVRSATAAGMRFVLVPDLVPASAENRARSWACLESLSQLPALLNKA